MSRREGRRKRGWKPVAAVLVCILTCLCTAAAGSFSEEVVRKVDPSVLEAAAEGQTDFFVVMTEQADLSAARGLPTKAAKGAFVYRALTDTAARTQPPVLAELKLLGARSVKPFWVVNMILVRGGLALVQAMAARQDVAQIYANPAIVLETPRSESGSRGPDAEESVEWNVELIHAPDVWSLGYTGQGVVVAGQDTGYMWNHTALKNQYRGWNGTSADHDYNWHDAIHTGGSSCGADTPAPCDDYGHGTHTMGTMVGDDGGSNRIGVAPGARWIGCRNMNAGVGTPATYGECFQWFIAPTDLDGLNPDPSMAPDVINDSWTCPPSEGCTNPDILKTIVENTRVAGIVVVASAGNEGSGCGTIDAPPAIYKASFSVGATNRSDGIASFSSRGPVTVDGSGRMKPDVSAPGVNVRSSVNYSTTSYTRMSGTSMAGPHVAGLVALILSARPDWKGHVALIEGVIERSAVPRTTDEACGGVPVTAVPNNTYGWGRIDALAAVAGDPDGDGVGDLEDCSPLDGATWALPGPAQNLRLTESGSTTLTWDAPDRPGGTSLQYDVLASGDPSDFSGAGAECLASGVSGHTATDATATSGVRFYVIRARNGCGSTLGADSAGVPRRGVTCP